MSQQDFHDIRKLYGKKFTLIILCRLNFMKLEQLLHFTHKIIKQAMRRDNLIRSDTPIMEHIITLNSKLLQKRRLNFQP